MVGGEFKCNGWRRVCGLRLEPGGEFKDVINIVLNNKHPYL